MRPWQRVSFIAAISHQHAINTIEVDWKALNWQRRRGRSEWLTPENEIVRYLRYPADLYGAPKPVRVYVGSEWWRRQDADEIREMAKGGRVTLIDPLDDLSEPAPDLATRLATAICNLSRVRAMCATPDELTDLHGQIQEIIGTYAPPQVYVTNDLKGFVDVLCERIETMTGKRDTQ